MFRVCWPDYCEYDCEAWDDSQDECSIHSQPEFCDEGYDALLEEGLVGENDF